jgi:hypothetical protein
MTRAALEIQVDETLAGAPLRNWTWHIRTAIDGKNDSGPQTTLKVEHSSSPNHGPSSKPRPCPSPRGATFHACDQRTTRRFLCCSQASKRAPRGAVPFRFTPSPSAAPSPLRDTSSTGRPTRGEKKRALKTARLPGLQLQRAHALASQRTPPRNQKQPLAPFRVYSALPLSSTRSRLKAALMRLK